MKQIVFDDISQEVFEAARDELIKWNPDFFRDGCGAGIHRSVKNAIVAAYNAGIVEEDAQQAQQLTPHERIELYELRHAVSAQQEQPAGLRTWFEGWWSMAMNVEKWPLTLSSDPLHYLCDETDRAWMACCHGVSHAQQSHPVDEHFQFQNEHVSEPCSSREHMAQQEQPSADLMRAIKSVPTFNMNGYDEDDVRRLHDWAVSVVYLADPPAPPPFVAQQEQPADYRPAAYATYNATTDKIVNLQPLTDPGLRKAAWSAKALAEGTQDKLSSITLYRKVEK